MSTAQRIAKNAGLLILGSAANFILGFFATMYIARYLDAEGYGTLSFATALTAIFAIFADLGLNALMIREIARDRTLAPKYLGNIAVLKLTLSVITFGMIALAMHLLDYPWETTEVVYLIALSALVTAFSDMFYAVTRAYERMEFTAIAQTVGSILILSGALLAIAKGFSVVGFAYIYLITALAMLAYSFGVTCWRFALPALELDVSFCKKTIRQAWPFAIIAVSMAVYYWIDSVMLSIMKDNEVVGWYSAAYRLVFLLQFIPQAYFGAVFPVMSRLYVTSRESLRVVYAKSVKYLFILAVPIAIGTTILAERIVTGIFGVEYQPSVIALQLLIWSMVATFMSASCATLLNSLNKQSAMAALIMATAVLNVALNLILIPRYGLTGASVATLITGPFAAFVAFALTIRQGYGFPVKSLIGVAGRVLISSAIMSVFVIYFEHKHIHLLLLIPLSALVYLVAIMAVRTLNKEDLLLFRSVIAREPAINSDNG